MAKHIVVWGDSIAAGFKDKELGGWVNRLKLHFMNTPDYISVQNCGVSGGTTFWLLKRFNVEAEAREPDIIIFYIGKNDSAKECNVSQKDFESNLNKLIKEAKNFTDKIIFIGMPKVDETKTTPFPKGVFPNYFNKNIKEYNATLEEICKKENLTFVSMEGVLDIKEDLYDGVHPNSKGHEKIFKKVLPFVDEMIKKNENRDIIIKESKIEGKGVFANRDFEKGEIVLKWNPIKLEKKDANNYPKKYVIIINKEYFLMQPPERYVNHSCEPNAQTDIVQKGDRAIRKIKKGEEITVRYEEDDFSDSAKCNCGSKNCKGVIR